MREAVLTGVDIASWGRDIGGGADLAACLEGLLAAVPELPRIRLSSLDPAVLDERFFRLFADAPRLQPQLHLSAQAGDGLVLKRMKRRHGPDDLLRVVEAARRARPGVALGADLIAGFPTESEEAFGRGLALMERLRPAKLHVFAYSERPGTPAARMPQVPPAERRRRAAALRALSARLEGEYEASLVGARREVLGLGDGSAHLPEGLRVPLAGTALAAGAFAEVRLAAAPGARNRAEDAQDGGGATGRGGVPGRRVDRRAAGRVARFEPCRRDAAARSGRLRRHRRSRLVSGPGALRRGLAKTRAALGLGAARKDAPAGTAGDEESTGGAPARPAAPPLDAEAALALLEERLLEADLGPVLAARLVKAAARAKVRRGQAPWGAFSAALEQAMLEVFADLPPARVFETGPADSPPPRTILLVGINGGGKTTTAAKLAARVQAAGGKPLLVGCDSFRAAASDQLSAWGGRIGCPVRAAPSGADPAALAFDGVRAGQAQGFDPVILDSAGRLHISAGLMDELAKTARAVAKARAGAPDETWLVMDAGIGRNAVAQAETFAKAVPLSGLILTKLDGTAKGGAALALADQCRLPIAALGIGEGAGDPRRLRGRRLRRWPPRRSGVGPPRRGGRGSAPARAARSAAAKAARHAPAPRRPAKRRVQARKQRAAARPRPPRPPAPTGRSAPSAPSVSSPPLRLFPEAGEHALCERRLACSLCGGHGETPVPFGQRVRRKEAPRALPNGAPDHDSGEIPRLPHRSAEPLLSAAEAAVENEARLGKKAGGLAHGLVVERRARAVAGRAQAPEPRPPGMDGEVAAAGGQERLQNRRERPGVRLLFRARLRPRFSFEAEAALDAHRQAGGLGHGLPRLGGLGRVTQLASPEAACHRPLARAAEVQVEAVPALFGGKTRSPPELFRVRPRQLEDDRALAGIESEQRRAADDARRRRHLAVEERAPARSAQEEAEVPVGPPRPSVRPAPGRRRARPALPRPSRQKALAGRQLEEALFELREGALLQLAHPLARDPEAPGQGLQGLRPGGEAAGG